MNVKFSYKPSGLYNESDSNQTKMLKVVTNNGKIRKDICSALPAKIR